MSEKYAGIWKFECPHCKHGVDPKCKRCKGKGWFEGRIITDAELKSRKEAGDDRQVYG